MAATKYSNCSTLALGCFLYDNIGLTIPVANGYYSDGVNQYQTSSGEIIGVTACSAPPSGTARYATTQGSVCSASPAVVYLSGTFGTGVTVYTDPSLSTALTGYNYISFEGGEIYNLNSTSAQVGAGTGDVC